MSKQSNLKPEWIAEGQAKHSLSRQGRLFFGRCGAQLFVFRWSV
jgi:hypothetical protein